MVAQIEGLSGKFPKIFICTGATPVVYSVPHGTLSEGLRYN